ncbi:hypothetical protein FNL37_2535 [Methylovorus glucosotrophus]|uniref:hypothetical protein n=1 Tax=Methylovorus glucosotrophus TaxID=266009 RepID=UPI0013311F42|nr:hypothetical protein [Methylovorus glucosotrophus]KAF0836228.1 hypothetical protein FNL37_2535 [Methylovorus glucosotrophus]
MNEEKGKAGLWELVKAISTVILVGVTAYKIYSTPTTLTVDFPTLLSLLLALFSVGLAALFYFKATETSNAFYDNTYKFTKDIAELLVKIESGFGERLRNLDEGYSSMRSYLQNIPTKHGDAVEKTKQKLETEQQEIEKVLAERNEIVQQLVERSHLEQEEKEKVLAKLKAKEDELIEAQREVSKLNKRLFMERMDKKRDRNIRDDTGMDRFTRSNVIEKIGLKKIIEGSPTSIRRHFDELTNNFPHQYIDDLEKHEYFDGGLTPSGMRYLREIALKLHDA